MVDVRSNAFVQRISEVQPPAAGDSVGREVVSEARSPREHEPIHADLVGSLRVREVPTERLARVRLVRLEEFGSRRRIRRNVDTVAVVPEHSVVRVESLQLVEIVWLVTEPLEESLEYVWQKIPRWTGVEAEPIPFDPTGDPTDLPRALVQRHFRVGGREVSRRREAADSAANDTDGNVVKHAVVHCRINGRRAGE